MFVDVEFLSSRISLVECDVLDLFVQVSWESVAFECVRIL